jgi:hypothetical protein
MPERPPRELVVGMPAVAPYLPDDAFAACMLCRVPIRHRSPIPDRVVLICLACFIVHADDSLVGTLTPEVADLALEALPVKGSPC